MFPVEVESGSAQLRSWSDRVAVKLLGDEVSMERRRPREVVSLFTLSCSPLISPLLNILISFSERHRA